MLERERGKYLLSSSGILSVGHLSRLGDGMILGSVWPGSTLAILQPTYDAHHEVLGNNSTVT